MARKSVFACLVLLGFFAVFYAQAPPAPLRAGITIEKYTVNYRIESDGTCTQIVETDRRPNSGAFLERLKKYEMQFNPALQEVEVLEASVVKQEGRRLAVQQSSIQIKPTPQAEAAPKFSSLRVLKIDFEDLEVGDLAHLKLRFKLIKPLIEGHFSAVETFPAVSRWNSVEINVSAPHNFPLEFEAIGMTGGKLFEEAGRVHWQWKTKIETPVGFETGAINYTDFSPRLAMSSFKNYDELGAAYWANAREKVSVTPEIQKLADEITGGLAEPRAQAAAIYRWVNKNIRYLLIFLGRDGFIPRDSKTTLANRYGDCKDYTNLIQTLLKAKGIESFPVLIHADTNYWLPKIPVSDYFNHAILYIPSLDVYADATAPHTRLGLLPQVLLGKTALLAGEKTGLIKIPGGKPEDNKFQTAIVINFQPDGSLKARAKNTYQGTLEMIYRALFADSEAVKSEMFFRGTYAYYGYTGNGRIVRSSNPFQTGEPFSVELEANLGSYVSFAKPVGLKVPGAVSLNNMLDLEKLVALDRRRTPLLTGAINFDENFEINFPSGVNIAAIPPGTNFKNPAGTFRSEYRLENNIVSLRRNLVIVKDVFQPDEYAAVRDLILTAVGDLKNEIRVSPTRDFAAPQAKTTPGNARQGGGKPGDPLAALKSAITGDDEPVITAQQVIQLEEILKQNPNDAGLRKRLIHFYSLASDKILVKNAPKFRGWEQKNVFEHYKWFVRNHPELNRRDIGLTALDLSPIHIQTRQYQELKAEWLKQVGARKNDAEVRLNAADFFHLREPQVAEKILLEGERLDAENYRLPLKLIEIYEKQSEDAAGVEAKRAFSAKIFEQGEKALNLLKQERTDARDKERGNLLPKLAKIAFELGDAGKAKVFATELILEFGDNSDDIKYADSVHAGNIILGKIALREDDLERAKDYLLIAIRAARHARYGVILPDLDLPKMLLAKGERAGVLEYLKLCEDLKDVNVIMLRRWQREIEENKTPSFEWDDYEMEIEARFKPRKNVPRRKS